MNDKETSQYAGFGFNVIVYSVTLIIACIFPFVARTVISLFLTTPSISSLKGDASYLFDIVYPIMGLFTTAAFFGGAFYCAFYSAKKIAYKSRQEFDKKKAIYQLAFAVAVATVFNIYLGVGDSFCGIFGFHYWYFPALLASLTGMIDKANALSYIKSSDIVITNFVILGLTETIRWLILLNFVIQTAGFAVCAYFGRKKGTAKGLANLEKDLQSLHG